MDLKKNFPYGLILTGNTAGRLTGGEMPPIYAKISRLLTKARENRPAVLGIARGRFPATYRNITILNTSQPAILVQRELARFVFEKGYHQAVYFVDEDVDSVEGIVHSFRFYAEIFHLSNTFKMKCIIKRSKSPEQRGKFFTRLHNRYSPQYLQSVLSKYDRFDQEKIGQFIEPVTAFKKSYSRYSNTGLWIFCNDTQATAALNWCREKMISVPREIAIVSLQNDPRFFHRGITTCVRDYEAIGFLMAHALIGDIPIQKTHHGYIQTHAHMLERQTTP